VLRIFCCTIMMIMSFSSYCVETYVLTCSLYLPPKIWSYSAVHPGYLEPTELRLSTSTPCYDVFHVSDKGSVQLSQTFTPVDGTKSSRRIELRLSPGALGPLGATCPTRFSILARERTGLLFNLETNVDFELIEGQRATIIVYNGEFVPTTRVVMTSLITYDFNWSIPNVSLKNATITGYPIGGRRPSLVIENNGASDYLYDRTNVTIDQGPLLAGTYTGSATAVMLCP